jgi:DNA repair protein RadC
MKRRLAFTRREKNLIRDAIAAIEGRYLVKGDPLTSPGKVRDYLKLQLEACLAEVFACIWLNSKHQVLAYDELFHGTIDQSSIYPREVVRRALELNAAAVILAHNHPSGNTTPSPADLNITARLREALALVDVRLLDHFIVGDGEPLSLAERGLL